MAGQRAKVDVQREERGGHCPHPNESRPVHPEPRHPRRDLLSLRGSGLHTRPGADCHRRARFLLRGETSDGASNRTYWPLPIDGKAKIMPCRSRRQPSDRIPVECRSNCQGRDIATIDDHAGRSRWLANARVRTRPVRLLRPAGICAALRSIHAGTAAQRPRQTDPARVFHRIFFAHSRIHGVLHQPGYFRRADPAAVCT